MKMNSANRQNTTGNIFGIIGAILFVAMFISVLIGIILVICKIANQTQLSWLKVLLPIITPLAIEFVVISVYVLMMYMGVLDRNAKKKEIGY